MAEITWKSILTKLVGGDHLSAEESEWFVDDLMNGNADPAAVGAVLATQQQLGLTPDEVRGAAKAMVAHAIPLHIDGETTDIVGTGGDGASTVNLSSMGAVVAAAAGVKVVKHGNRAASSKCGTADCFEALGLPMDLTPEQVSEVGNECGIAFAFARTFHPAMRFVGPIRAALGVPCVFNVLGPLTNPASPKHMAVGCANRKMSPIMAAVYAANGQIGMVYTSHEGLDEMAPTGPVSIWEFKDGKVTENKFDPTVELGLAKVTIADLKGGEPTLNAQLARDFFAAWAVAIHLSSSAVALPESTVIWCRATQAWLTGSKPPTPSRSRPSTPARPRRCLTSGSPPPKLRRKPENADNVCVCEGPGVNMNRTPIVGLKKFRFDDRRCGSFVCVRIEGDVTTTGSGARRWSSSSPEPARTRLPAGLPYRCIPRETGSGCTGPTARRRSWEAAAADATTGRRRSPRRATTSRTV